MSVCNLSEENSVRVALMLCFLGVSGLSTLAVFIYFCYMLVSRIPKEVWTSKVTCTNGTVLTLLAFERTLRPIEIYLRLVHGDYTPKVRSLYHLNNTCISLCATLCFIAQNCILKQVFDTTQYRVPDRTIWRVTWATRLFFVTSVAWGVSNDIRRIENSFLGRMYLICIVFVVFICGAYILGQLNYEFGSRLRKLVADFTASKISLTAMDFKALTVQQPIEMDEEVNLNGEESSSNSLNQAVEELNFDDEPIKDGNNNKDDDNVEEDVVRAPPKRGERMKSEIGNDAADKLKLAAGAKGVGSITVSHTNSSRPSSTYSECSPALHKGNTLTVTEIMDGKSNMDRNSFSTMFRKMVKQSTISNFDQSQRKLLILAAKSTVLSIANTLSLITMCTGIAMFSFARCLQWPSVFGNMFSGCSIVLLSFVCLLELKDSKMEYEFLCFVCHRWTKKIVAYQTDRKVDKIHTRNTLRMISQMSVEPSSGLPGDAINMCDPHQCNGHQLLPLRSVDSYSKSSTVTGRVSNSQAGRTTPVSIDIPILIPNHSGGNNNNSAHPSPFPSPLPVITQAQG